MQWENVHVFISSTFNDMHAERDYLVKSVFPQLSAWCEERKLRLIDIDLRWGVSEADATENRRVVQVCLDRIDQCRPFFLCFLGQRRGWVPGREDISGETYDAFGRLAEGGYAGSASVTEMEMLHALVDPMHGGLRQLADGTQQELPAAEHSFFYLREAGYLSAVHDERLLDIYTNSAENDPATADAELGRWREQVVPGTGRPVCRYAAHWDEGVATPEIAWPYTVPTTAPQGSAQWERALQKWRAQWASVGVEAGPEGELSGPALQRAQAFNTKLTAGRLTAFQSEERALAGIILEQLKEAITARFGERRAPDDTPLQQELDRQAQFLRIASEGFIQYGADTDALRGYLEGGDARPLAVTAGAGMGKTSLLAHCIDTWRPADDRETLHYRFIGASDDSVNVERLVRSLLWELKQAGKIGADIPLDPDAMMVQLPFLLEEAGKNGRTLLVIDALNQLESGMERLDWIPVRLPENVRLIVSFKLGEAEADAFCARLRETGAMRLHALAPFEHAQDRISLVNAYLSGYFKELDDSRLDTLVSSEGAENPLFLKTVLSELRIFGAHQNLGEMIRRNFGATPASAFGALLRRMEGDPSYSGIPNSRLIPHLFGWLSHARHGLSVDELAGLCVQGGLSDDAEALTDSILLVLRQLRPYLARRDGRTDFFYESFLIASRERYTSDHPLAKPPAGWHGDLAQYFETLPLENRHRLMEQAFQYAHAAQGGALAGLLLEPAFLEARLAQFGPEELAADLGLALQPGVGVGEPEAKTLELLRDCIRLGAETLAQDPGQLAAQLWGRMAEVEDGGIRALLARVRQQKTGVWLRPETRCMDAPGGAALRVWRAQGGLSGKCVKANWEHGLALAFGSSLTVDVIDLASERFLRRFRLDAQSHGVLAALEVSSDAKQAFIGVTGSTAAARALHLYDIHTGECLHSFPLPGENPDKGMLFSMGATPGFERVIASYMLADSPRRSRIDCFEQTPEGWREVWSVQLDGFAECVTLSKDGRLAAAGFITSEVNSRQFGLTNAIMRTWNT